MARLKQEIPLSFDTTKIATSGAASIPGENVSYRQKINKWIKFQNWTRVGNFSLTFDC